MRLRAFAAVLCALALSCSREPEPDGLPPQLAERSTDLAAEARNVLSIANGAVVTARSGEADLDASAIHAVDGDDSSIWSSPSDSDHLWMTVQLPAPAQVQRFIFEPGGLTGPLFPAAIRLEALEDNGAATELGVIRPEQSRVVDLAATTVQALRITMEIDPKTGAAAIPSLRLEGTPGERFPQADATGSWSINQTAAVLVQRSSWIRGAASGNPRALFEGSQDGAVIKLRWSEGASYGVGIMTIDPAARRLNALLWYLDPVYPFFRASWFGERTDTPGGALPAMELRELFLRKENRVPLYELSFNAEGVLQEQGGAIDALAQWLKRQPAKFTFVAHKIGTDRATAQRVSETMRDTLRTALQKRGVEVTAYGFEAAGDRRPPNPVRSAVQQLLYTRVDLVAAESRPGAEAR